MLDFWQAHKDWVQYDNGSFEPVDNKTGDINKKPRNKNEADWWVTRKEPSWQPPKFANTKRGQQAKKDYHLTTTLEKKPAISYAKTALFTQPQHQNTGHAKVRLSGPEDGKITTMQGGLNVKNLASNEDNPNFERTIFEYLPDPILTPFMTYGSRNKMRARLRNEKLEYTDENDWRMRLELEKEAEEYGMLDAARDSYLFRNDDRAFQHARKTAAHRIGATKNPPTDEHVNQNKKK